MQPASGTGCRSNHRQGAERIRGVQTGRHIIMVAALALGLGVGIYLAPDQFDTPLWLPLQPQFPTFSALLTAGGVLLLLQIRFPLPRWIRRLLFTVPLGGLGWLSGYLLLHGNPLLGAAIGLMAAGVALAAWLPAEAGYQWSGPDLGLATMGLIQILFGGAMLLAPERFLAYPFEPLAGKLIWTGLSGLIGGGVLLLWVFTRKEDDPKRLLWWVPSGIFSLLLGATFLLTEPQTGVMIWVTAGALFAVKGRIAPLRQTALEPTQHFDLLVESLSWVLVLIVVVSALLGDPLVAQVEAHLYVLLVVVYNVTVPWVLRPFIPLIWRIRSHMLFYPLTLGLLLIHEGQFAPVYFAVLIILPMGVALAMGVSAGIWQIGVSVAVITSSRTLEHLMGGLSLVDCLIEGGLQVVILLVVAGFGVSRAAEYGRLTERVRRREEELEASEERFRSAFEHAPIGVALVGLDGRYWKVNPAFCRTLGYSTAELLDTNLREHIAPEDLPRVVEYAQAAVKGEVWFRQFETRLIHRGGQAICTLCHANLVLDGQGKPAYYVFQIQDIMERKAFEQAMAHAAEHDLLTDLYNRRGFYREMEEALEQEGGRAALILMDLDQFKYVNDSLGHQAGDEILRSIAALLTDLVDAKGTLARLGGDEFAILLPGAVEGEAVAFAARVVEAINAHAMLVQGHPIAISASLGVVLYPEHTRKPEDLVALADMAMYRAKEGGRSRFYLWQATDDERDRDHGLAWERRIRLALEEERFHLYGQPIMDLELGEITRYELLLRMVEADGTVISPGAFLPQAERFGLIAAIDRWVISRAIRVIAEMERQGRALPLEVNLSGYAVTDPDLLRFVQRHLAESGINPANLIVEITETWAVFDMTQARKFVETLKALGCQFAIDDFGAGFSSFNYLKQLAVDYLKIDGSLVQGLGGDPVNQQLIQSIAGMCRGLGKRTVAEYVEDEETLALLRSYGVHYAQGYYIGRPQPLSEVLLPEPAVPKG